MSEQDKYLLDTYMLGFNEELNDKPKRWNPNPLLLHAYNLGREDAIICDNVRSVKHQTNEVILNRIWNRNDTNDDLRFKIEANKSLIYDNKTDKDICMYFDEETRDWLLNLLNTCASKQY